MKKLFGSILLIFIVASILTIKTLPGATSDKPVLYWVTDPNPARVEQIRSFANWLRKTHPDAPEVEIRVDAANSSAEKVLIQGVSGVCGDLIDHSGGAAMRFRKSVGILADITEVAKARGFDVSKTFPAIASELQSPMKVVCEDGEVRYETRQFCFPCNVSVEMFWVNNAAFEKVGMPAPPLRWTLEEFERIGKEFIERSNPEGETQRVFFVPDVSPIKLAKTAGGSLFNETETAPAINCQAMIDAFNLRYKWTFERPRLIPTASERSSFAAGSGYGGAGLAMFTEGNYALVGGGRYLLIQFRKIAAERIATGEKPLALSVSEPPYQLMPTTTVFTRATAVYAGGKNTDLALYFMEFLSSEAYNMNIVMDGDALPPNPAYLEIEAYKRPEAHPEEWGCHEAFSEAINTIGCPDESSPFVIDDVVTRLVNKAQDYHLNNLKTARESLEGLETEICGEIQRSLSEDADLLPLYEQRCKIQEKIDALRANGQAVPLSWISNPFLKRWYQFNGWADVNL